MQSKNRVLIILIAATFLACTTHAEVLLIDRVEQSQELQLPKRASTMGQVRNQFGEPERVVPAVGEPPITQWVYAGFTVYFENEYVINSVMHKASAGEQGPKPVDSGAVIESN